MSDACLRNFLSELIVYAFMILHEEQTIDFAILRDTCKRNNLWKDCKIGSLSGCLNLTKKSQPWN